MIWLLLLIGLALALLWRLAIEFSPELASIPMRVLAGSGSNPITGSISFFVLLMLGVVTTTAVYKIAIGKANSPQDYVEKLKTKFIEESKFSNEGNGVPQEDSDSTLLSYKYDEESNAIVFEYANPKSKLTATGDETKKPGKFELFRLQFRIALEDHVFSTSESLSAELLIPTLQQASVEAIHGENLHPAYRSDLMRFYTVGKYKILPVDIDGVNNYTNEYTTPASVHVVEWAVRYAFKYLNEIRDDHFSPLGYETNETLQEELVMTFRSQFRDELGSISRDTYFFRLFHGPIQWATFVVFFALLLHLMARYCVNVIYENKFGKNFASIFQTPVGPVLDPDTVEKRKDIATLGLPTKKLERFLWPFFSSHLQIYIQGASAFGVEKGYGSVPTNVAAAADNILNEQAARASFIKFCIWSIPTIGFIGTVVGIGGALMETMNVDAVDDVTRAIAKSSVSSSIGVAFDTTLVALFLSLPAMFFYHVVSKYEEIEVIGACKKVNDSLNFRGSFREKEELVEDLKDSLKRTGKVLMVAHKEAKRTLRLNNELEVNIAKIPKRPLWGTTSFWMLVLVILSANLLNVFLSSH